MTSKANAKFIKVSGDEWIALDGIEAIHDLGGEGFEIRTKTGRQYRIADAEREYFLDTIGPVTTAPASAA